MKPSVLAALAVPFLAFASSAAPTSAQGATDYLNFESPQVKPIAVGRVGTQDLVMVCNTPDNTVELYDITSNPDSPVFVARVPVGLEPVSVVYHRFTSPPRNMLYTANWLGDSVTYVELFETAGEIDFSVLGERTVVGHIAGFAGQTHVHAFGADPLSHLLRGDDEPMHLAVLDHGAASTLIVTKRTGSSYSRVPAFDPAALPPSAKANDGSCVTFGGANVIVTAGANASYVPLAASGTGNGQFPLGHAPAATGSASRLLALKEPHTVLARPGQSEFWILGHQGGGSKIAHSLEITAGSGTLPLPRFDFDLWGIRYASDCTTEPTYFNVRGLGTTNFNMAFSPDGAGLYVVGTDALNDIEGNVDLLGEETGFVKTMIHRVQVSDFGVVPSPRIDPKDLNLGPGGLAVDGADSLAHATDVGVYRPPESSVDSVFVVAFNSDRFGILEYDTATNQFSEPRRCDIAAIDRFPNVLGVQGAAGPRGLAVFDPARFDPAKGPEDVRVYVLNRLDNTFVVIDPRIGSTLDPVAGTPIPLALDPVPAHIRNGQRFLYSTQFSQSRFVSCASCHVDARSDQIQWRLSVDADPIPLLPPPGDIRVVEAFQTLLSAAEALASEGMPADAHAANPKGPMVTQSLQGLLNFEVLGTLFEDPTGNVVDDLVSNAPYHWRGDKESFRHFNEAFVNLQGMPFIDNPGEEPDGGLRALSLSGYNENRSYETFINSIAYPPNPLQPRERSFSGEPFDPDVATSGTLGQRGLMVFHEGRTSQFDGRSCVQCHFLPEGSNNRISCFVDGQDTTDPEGTGVTGVLGDGIRQPTETAALRGLTQKDGALQLNGLVPPPGLPPLIRILTGDRGTGREGLRGHTRSEFFRDVTSLPVADRNAVGVFLREIDHGVAPVVGLVAVIPGQPAELALMEEQAREANCGIAVYGEILDPVAGTPVKRRWWYRFDDAQTQVYAEDGGGVLTSTALVALTASPGGRLIFRAVPLGSERRIATSGTLPIVVAPVPGFVRIVGTTPNTAYERVPELLRNWRPGIAPTDFSWSPPGATGDQLVEPLSLRAVRAFQLALEDEGVLVNHDAPRRLQVVGEGLEQGARIRLKVPDTAGILRTMILPVHPTDEELSSGEMIWETAVEFDPLALYMLMLGGPADPEVQCVLRNDDEPGFVSDADLVTRCAPSAAGVTYALDAQNAGQTWASQPPTSIPYPKLP
jgi:hypothetical protein